MGVDVCTYRARIGTFFPSRAHGCRRVDCFFEAFGLTRVLCPKPSSLLLSMCLALLLLSAGDVEANPGPKIDDVLALVKECHEETKTALAEIKQHITSIDTRVRAIERSMKNVSDCKVNIDAAADSVKEVKVHINKANEELVDLVDDMNNRMRRNNLIIKGLDEVEHEDYVESERIVREFFSKHLRHDVGDIERAHRVGRSRPNFHRPLIVKFLNFKSKIEALSLGHKLKNLESPKVWLEEDFSQKVQFARMKLREFGKANRTDGEKYYVRFNKLHTERGIYRYDSSINQVVQVSAKNQPSSR